MGALESALKQERWEEAALRLVIGVLQTASSVPDDALDGLIEALEGVADGQS